MKTGAMIFSGTVIIFLLLNSFAFSQILPEDPAEGGRLFESKGCVKCHAVRGVGGKVGPDLGMIDLGDTQLDLAAQIWNHTPSMIAGMEQAGILRPTLTGQEFTEITAYLYFLRFFDEPGDVASGRYLYEQKGCFLCHLSVGKNEVGARSLDEFPRNISPVFLSQAIWNHSVEMIARMVQIGMRWPYFAGTQMMDLLEYIKANARGPEEPAFLKPGNPKEGKRVFDTKGCTKCHSVRGEGALNGIDLGKRAKEFYTSLTRIASNMWNKGPLILIRMSQIQCGTPELTQQEMADLMAYLYFLHYIDEPGDGARGEKLFSEMGCSQCHSIEGKQGNLAHIHLSKFRNAAETEIVAAIWNHSLAMRKATAERGIPWPQFKKGEMADLLEFIRNPRRK